ncbi:MAG TPA: slipin family protein [Gemmatimonadaceae bacterium]|jgi:regulator of protease activity HflC (stomatin/prohibitin superfamily)
MNANIVNYLIAAAVAVFLFQYGVRIVKQYEGGVVLRFGRLIGVRAPGLRFIFPLIDRMFKIDTRVVTLTVEPQELITRDNVTIKVDAVVYFQVVDCAKALIQVEHYDRATSQIALTTLRSVLGQSELDELLAQRDKINQKLATIIDHHTEPWGVKVSVVEVKDVLLPETMQRSMAAQAEAEREKRAKIIRADGEFLAAETLGKAAVIIRDNPPALQLRYLQTLTEMTSNGNGTIVPVTMDLLGGIKSAFGGESK